MFVLNGPRVGICIVLLSLSASSHLTMFPAILLSTVGAVLGLKRISSTSVGEVTIIM